MLCMCTYTVTQGLIAHTEHSETSWKSTSVRAQQLAFTSSDIPAACTQLELSYGHFAVGVFMVTAQPGAFGSLKGDRKGAAWISCPLRSSSSTPGFGTRLSPVHQIQSWLSVKTNFCDKQKSAPLSPSSGQHMLRGLGASTWLLLLEHTLCSIEEHPEYILLPSVFPGDK